MLAAYLPRHNTRFHVPPADPQGAWRPLPAGRPGEAVFCFRHPRRIARDGTFTLGAPAFMLVGRAADGWNGRALEIQERLDGSLWVELEGVFRPVVPAPDRPIVLCVWEAHPRAPHVRRTAPADHPWRRYPAIRPQCQTR